MPVRSGKSLGEAYAEGIAKSIFDERVRSKASITTTR